MTCDRSVVFSGNSVSNKTDRHDIIKILLKVALNTINPYLEFYFYLILGQKKMCVSDCHDISVMYWTYNKCVFDML